jgi:peroxiredoxin
MLARILTALSFVAILHAQDDPKAVAHAMYEEIRKLPEILPEAARDDAFRAMLLRIRREPKQYRLALASNLAVSAGEVATASGTLQEIADLLVDEMRDAPERASELERRSLAEFALYRHIRVSLDDPLYRAELAKLEDQTRMRAKADFKLTDLTGKQWHLKELRGKVVLVNFWATWCAPCQREIADFQAMHERFAGQGLLILAVTSEDAATVKRCQADRPFTFRVLLDPGDIAKKQFLVDGIPYSMLYNREGRMVAEIPGPSTMEQLLGTLREAGLK